MRRWRAARDDCAARRQTEDERGGLRARRAAEPSLMTDRERALLLLRRIERESSFASPLLHNETGFVRTLVLGVLRWRSRIDHAIATLASRRIEKLDPVVVELLRVGLYQLMFMDV